MADVVKVKLSEQSIENAIKQIEAYRKRIERKKDLLAKRLADLGATKVSGGYELAQYDGRKDISVSVERTQNGYAIVANGESVLFVEFGAGVTYGYGHPENGKFGLGPGTYPSDKGHWDDPKGWWIPVENGGGHTYGNAPSMTMYRTEQELEQELLTVAQEVFAGD